MKFPRSLLSAAIAVVMACQGAYAATYRYTIMSHSDFGAKKGFYLNLEGEGPDGGLIGLNQTKLVMGVADGKGWRFAISSPNWKTDTAYDIRAVADKGRVEVWMNGALVAKTAGGFIPHEGPGEYAGIPDWGASPTSFITRQTSVEVLSGGATVFNKALTPAVAGPLSLFGRVGSMSKAEGISETAGQPLEVRASISFAPIVKASEVAPLVDRYGQSIHAEWPDKVRSDADLKASTALEKAKLKEWGVPANRDRFGGSKDLGWSIKGSGYYRVAKKNGMWWLISPEGNPVFYTGLCTAPSPTYPRTPVSDREYMIQELPPMEDGFWGRDMWGEGDGTEYAGFIPWNLKRKYGEDWNQASVSITGQRIRAWGFSGIGKWGGMAGLPSIPVLGRHDVPNLVEHPDIFDEDVQDQFRISLAQQIVPRKHDSTIVGWSLGNEFGEIITKDEVRRILAMEGTNPSKAAMVEYARNALYNGSLDSLKAAWKAKGDTGAGIAGQLLTVPSKDLTELRRFYADAYYSFIYKTVKSLDRNHLYFGFWIVPGWWDEEADWDIAARHVDVIGYDRYAPTLMDDGMIKRVERTNKPILLGEFSYPPTYGGARAFGTYGLAFTDSEEEAAAKYRELMWDAARNPMVVGALWFEYRDQPITGRGPGRGDMVAYGEHYAFGLVDVTDRPKWTMVEGMRKVNLEVPYIRAKARP